MEFSIRQKIPDAFHCQVYGLVPKKVPKSNFHFKMVEAAGVEPASSEPQAQMYYKLSQCCFSCFVTDNYTRGWRHFIQTRLLTLPSFFCSLSTPQLLNEHPEQDGQLTQLQQPLRPNQTQRESHQLRQAKEPYQHYWQLNTLIDDLRGLLSSSACNSA